jgi:tight adherence protein C
MVFLISAVVGLTVLALIMGVRAFATPSQSTELLQQKVVGVTPGEVLTLRQIEMRPSFYRRVVQPLFMGSLQRLGRLAPQRNIEALHKKLRAAGSPGNLNVADFLGIKILVGAILGFMLMLLTYVARPDFGFIVIAGVGLAFGFVGVMLPNVWLTRRITNRKAEIVKKLPDALDMLTICVGAGLGLTGAIQRVAEAWDNALCDEFDRLLTEVKLGRTNVQGLQDMADRTDVDELRSFVMAITLTLELGTSVAHILLIQAEQMRILRRQKAEEAARQAAIKMLFPLVFLIFPALFAVLLGPAIPLILETFGSL